MVGCMCRHALKPKRETKFFLHNARLLMIGCPSEKLAGTVVIVRVMVLHLVIQVFGHQASPVTPVDPSAPLHVAPAILELAASTTYARNAPQMIMI